MDAADKQWFEDLFRNVQQQSERRFEQIDRRFEEVEQKIEKVETNLLTEFHKWASPLEMRQRSHSAVLRALDMELESVIDRVKKLEEKN
jgi:hypothetical protein